MHVAPTSRHEDPALDDGAPDCRELEEALRADPFAFDFFQAVRLLALLQPGRKPVGQFSNPETEIVRFGAGAELGFPASQIAGLEWPEKGQPRMRVNFMGLTGPHGVLPLYYSTLVRERLRAHDAGLREFLDIFNHRVISLFYQAWEKCHLGIGYERGADDRLSPMLRDLIGLGTPGLTGRQPVPDQALLFRCGLLAGHSRSAAALRALLIDYFEVPVEVGQFVGRWHPIDEDTQCRFTGTLSYSEQLGQGAVVGDELWDQQSGVRIRLGPLSLEQYREFLPDGPAHEPMRALVRIFAGNELEFEVQLVLRKEERPPCELGGDGPDAPRLGWLTWAGTAPPAQDPDQSILRI